MKLVVKLHTAVHVYTYESYRIGEDSEKNCNVNDHVIKNASAVAPSFPKHSGSSL